MTKNIEILLYRYSTP